MEYINNLELWRTISGFPKYMVSSCGRVMNLTTFRILKPQITSDGYLYVVLYSNCDASTKKIHRLVGESFILNLTDLPCIDHIDRKRINNNLSNLRWCTRKENDQNRSKRKNTSSIYKGVHLIRNFDKKANKWRAQIRHDGQLIHLGCYTDESDAGRAYDRKASELFREFAHLNF